MGKEQEKMSMKELREKDETQWGDTGHTKFSQQEWERASGLAVKLLEALGPRQQSGCQECNPPAVLFPNYRMKYELAKALRSVD